MKEGYAEGEINMWCSVIRQAIIDLTDTSRINRITAKEFLLSDECRELVDNLTIGGYIAIRTGKRKYSNKMIAIQDIEHSGLNYSWMIEKLKRRGLL